MFCDHCEHWIKIKVRDCTLKDRAIQTAVHALHYTTLWLSSTVSSEQLGWNSSNSGRRLLSLYENVKEAVHRKVSTPCLCAYDCIALELEYQCT